MALLMPGRIIAVLDLLPLSIFFLDLGVRKSDSIIINKFNHHSIRKKRE